MTIRSPMILILELIGPEMSKLSALELENLPYIWLCLHSSICKYWPVSTKLGHNIYAYKVSDEFYYRTNQIRTSAVICPWIWKKIAEYDFVYTLSSTNIDQSTLNLVKMYMIIQFDYGSNTTRTVRVICSWIRKFAIFDSVYTPASANIDQSVPNLATIYMPIRSQMSWIRVKLNQNIRSYLPLNLEKLLNMTLFTPYHLQILTNQHLTWSKCMWL